GDISGHVPADTAVPCGDVLPGRIGGGGGMRGGPLGQLPSAGPRCTITRRGPDPAPAVFERAAARGGKSPSPKVRWGRISGTRTGVVELEVEPIGPSSRSRVRGSLQWAANRLESEVPETKEGECGRERLLVARLRGGAERPRAHDPDRRPAGRSRCARAYRREDRRRTGRADLREVGPALAGRGQRGRAAPRARWHHPPTRARAPAAGAERVAVPGLPHRPA